MSVRVRFLSLPQRWSTQLETVVSIASSDLCLTNSCSKVLFASNEKVGAAKVPEISV